MRHLLLAITLLAIEFIFIIIHYDHRPIRLDRDSMTSNQGSEFSLKTASEAQSSNMQILTTVPVLRHHMDRNPINAPPVGGSPQLFGWTPDSYPDPLVDTVRCSLSFLPDSITSTIHDLRLCDPDWVLGVNYLHDIAVALHNFTDMFTNQWDVGVVGDTNRALLASSSEHLRHRPHQTRHLLPSNDFQFSSPLQRSASDVVQKMIPNPWSAEVTTGATRYTPMPQVSLAVAIVRKVRS